MPLVRIVTVGYRNPEGLMKLFRSLREHWTTGGEFILQDNGESGAAARLWDSEGPGHARLPLQVNGTGRNLGFAAGVNRAAELDTGRAWTHLLLINPDARFASDVTPELVERLAQEKGLLGFRVFDDAAKQVRQMSARRFPSFWTSVSGREGVLTKLFPGNPLSRRYLAQDLNSDTPAAVDWLSGCALWMARADWERLRGFDESYFLYVEDVDLGRKAQRAGLPVRYFPVIDVIHESRGSARKAPWKADYYHHLGMWIYHIKWAGFWGWVFGPFVFLGICARFALRRIKT
jgi:GT2 family glycosyltransferase